MSKTTLTNDERVAYALRKLNQWLGNYEANGARHVREGRPEKAASCAAHAQDVRDIIAMLDGTEDDYIATVAYLSSLRMARAK